jgi:transposase|tara:strand:- start:72 stop:1169 length:1098 start_codon:yes stop_codon:yes gene_type:complete
MPRRLKKATYWNIVTLHFDWGEYQNQAEIAKACGCAQSTVSEALRRFDGVNSNPCPKSFLKQKDRRLGKDASAYMVALLGRYPDLYISEIAHELQAKFRQNFSLSRVCRALKDHSFSYKVLERIARRRDQQERHNWRETLLNGDHENFVFIDESHFRNDTVRRVRGRSLRGTPARAVSCLGSYQALSLIAACTCRGMIVDACKSYMGGVNHDVLIEWATFHLLPNMPTGSILVMDNASIHHDVEFKQLLERAKLDPKCGMIDYLYLPPYSPDYNPIERCFAQIKADLRKRQHVAVHNVESAIQESLLVVSESSLRKYYRAAGMNVQTLEEIELAAVACVCFSMVQNSRRTSNGDIVAFLRALGRC